MEPRPQDMPFGLADLPADGLQLLVDGLALAELLHELFTLALALPDLRLQAVGAAKVVQEVVEAFQFVDVESWQDFKYSTPQKLRW